MKQLLSFKEDIFCQAYPKRQALIRLSLHSQNIDDHVIKCVVYGRQMPENLHHWIQELSTWLAEADSITCKSKIKESEYIDQVFGMFGDSVGDAYLNLKQFKFRYVDQLKEYPDFVIDSTIIDRLFDTYLSITEESLKYLLSSKKHSKSEWYRLLNSLLNR